MGKHCEKNNVIRIGDVELDKDAKEVRVNGKLVKMTATEYGILQLLMENAGKVFSIDEIYERVWNESSFSPENTFPYIFGGFGRKSRLTRRNRDI